MSIIADSGAIYALYDKDDAHHKRVCRVVEQEPDIIIIPAPILVEIDYLIREFVGIEAELDFLEDLMDGAYRLEALLPEDVERCHALIRQYRDLDLGLADTTVMAVAERLDCYRILTVDERDFRAVKPRKGHFTLLPADV